MNLRRVLILIIILLVIIAFKPKTAYGEFKRIWDHRDAVLRMLVIVIGIYLLYGLYSMYSRGMLPF